MKKHKVFPVMVFKKNLPGRRLPHMNKAQTEKWLKGGAIVSLGKLRSTSLNHSGGMDFMTDIALAPTKENGAAVFAATIEKGGDAIGMALMPGMLEVAKDDPWTIGFVKALRDYLALDKLAVRVLSSKQTDELEGHTHNERSVIGGPKRGDIWANQFGTGMVA